MSGLTFQKVLQILNPLQPPELAVAGITLYLIGILVLIGLFLQPDGSTRDTMILTAVLLIVLIDKVATTSVVRDTLGGITSRSFLTFILRVGLFAPPFIVAGSTKAPKSRGWLIGAGVLGALYLFARWFFEIRPQ